MELTVTYDCVLGQTSTALYMMASAVVYLRTVGRAPLPQAAVVNFNQKSDRSDANIAAVKAHTALDEGQSSVR